MTRLDFEQEIEALFDDNVATPETLTIWGGDFVASEIADFLAIWEWSQMDMPWRIWEWASDMAFEHQTGTPTPAAGDFRSMAWLERARFFGPSGDLELRRDGERFLWRFVGGVKKIRASQGFEPDNYWKDRATWRLHVKDRVALLWGQELPDHLGQWQEDRVAAAQLHYPNTQGDEQGRVRLHYREYLRGGNVEAVWWLGLKPQATQTRGGH